MNLKISALKLCHFVPAGYGAFNKRQGDDHEVVRRPPTVLLRSGGWKPEVKSSKQIIIRCMHEQSI